jgi:hypothetical protein
MRNYLDPLKNEKRLQILVSGWFWWFWESMEGAGEEEQPNICDERDFEGEVSVC